MEKTPPVRKKQAYCSGENKLQHVEQNNKKQIGRSKAHPIQGDINFHSEPNEGWFCCKAEKNSISNSSTPQDAISSQSMSPTSCEYCQQTSSIYPQQPQTTQMGTQQETIQKGLRRVDTPCKNDYPEKQTDKICARDLDLGGVLQHKELFTTQIQDRQVKFGDIAEKPSISISPHLPKANVTTATCTGASELAASIPPQVPRASYSQLNLQTALSNVIHPSPLPQVLWWRLPGDDFGTIELKTTNADTFFLRVPMASAQGQSSSKYYTDAAITFIVCYLFYTMLNQLYVIFAV